MFVAAVEAVELWGQRSRHSTCSKDGEQGRRSEDALENSLENALENALEDALENAGDGEDRVVTVG